MIKSAIPQRGFTLMELLIAMVVLGAIIAASAPLVSFAFTLMENTKRSQETLDNRKMADAFIEFASERSGVNRGRLPAPIYTTAAPVIKGGLYNPAATDAESIDLGRILLTTGVPVGAINNDRAAVRNGRVYQLVSGLTHSSRLYGVTGPVVNLTYDFGVIVSTQCSRTSSCYTNGTVGNPPGDSARITAANYSAWEPTANDYGAIAFSTLDEQKTLLRVTVGRLNNLSERFTNNFHNKVRLASADSTTNFFEINSGGLNLGNVNPAVNMGCRDGWYNLAAANVDVLTKLGMDKTEHGVNAWGGIISYCRDFDPAGTGTHNSPPHYGALRIHRNVTTTTAPTVVNDAVIVTF